MQNSRPLSFTSSKQEIIECPRKNYNDVLLGRGGNNNKYPGNEQLRIFARNSARQYSLSGKLHISELSRTLVTRVRQLDPPGRFLKQNQTTKVWVDVGDITAREKTSQELRDAMRALPRDYPYDARSSLSKKANRISQTFKDRPRKRADNHISTKLYYTEPLCQKGSYYTEPLCQNGNSSIIARSAIMLNTKNRINPTCMLPTASGHNRLKRCTTSVLCLSDYQQKKQKPEPLCQNGNSSIITRSAIMLDTKNSSNPTSMLTASGHNRLKRCTTSVLCLSDYHQKQQRKDCTSPSIPWKALPTYGRTAGSTSSYVPPAYYASNSNQFGGASSRQQFGTNYASSQMNPQNGQQPACGGQMSLSNSAYAETKTGGRCNAATPSCCGAGNLRGTTPAATTAGSYPNAAGSHGRSSNTMVGTVSISKGMSNNRMLSAGIARPNYGRGGTNAYSTGDSNGGRGYGTTTASQYIRNGNILYQSSSSYPEHGRKKPSKRTLLEMLIFVCAIIWVLLGE